MAKSLIHRHREPEWMDAPDVDPIALESALGFIRNVNALLGYSRATIHHLQRLIHESRAGASGLNARQCDRAYLSPDQTLTILDVATGSADIPLAICQWADRKGIAVKIIALDLHNATLQTAARLVTDKRITMVRGDATSLPFENATFDFVLTGMFLHHLGEPVAITVLKEMDRAAKHGVIIADLLRSRRAYAWITLFTLLADPMVKHDARVSVQGAFSWDELSTLARTAGLGYLKPYRHFGHRMVLAGLKSSISS